MNFAEFGGQHDVAGQRDVGAGARGDAVDGADDRLRCGADQADQRVVECVQRLGEVRRSVHLARIAVAEILSGAEALAVAGQEDGAAGFVAGCLFQRGAQRQMHLLVESVAPVGPVEGDFDPAVMPGRQDCFAHAIASHE